MPTLLELRRRFERPERCDAECRGEVVESDIRGSLSPREVVDRKLQVTLEATQAGRRRQRLVARIPR